MFKCFPALVVVPNSTITNWVREFERWAPKLRVVPFYGEAKAREIIKKFELFHPRPAPGTTGAKYHVLVTTYETITNTKEFGPVFKGAPVWEMLVVDEGQRRGFPSLRTTVNLTSPSQERCEPHIQALKGVKHQTPDYHDGSKSSFHFLKI